MHLGRDVFVPQRGVFVESHGRDVIIAMPMLLKER